MSLVATVLYEDQMQPGSEGALPAHDLLLAMVRDDMGMAVWELRKRIRGNPRKGIDKLIADVARTQLLAGPGLLCLVVDKDRIAPHLGLPHNASEVQVTAEIAKRSNAPSKLRVHFLVPNMEGLLRSIADCDGGTRAPHGKNHNERDLFLKKAAFAPQRALRDCVREKQPSLGKLAGILAGSV